MSFRNLIPDASGEIEDPPLEWTRNYQVAEWEWGMRFGSFFRSPKKKFWVYSLLHFLVSGKAPIVWAQNYLSSPEEQKHEAIINKLEISGDNSNIRTSINGHEIEPPFRLRLTNLDFGSRLEQFTHQIPEIFEPITIQWERNSRPSQEEIDELTRFSGEGISEFITEAEKEQKRYIEETDRKNEEKEYAEERKDR